MVARLQSKGLANVTASMVAYTTAPAKYLQWGTGNGQIITDNTLNDDASDTYEAANLKRLAGTASTVTTSYTNDTYQVTGTLTAGGALAIKEVGVFDAEGSGNPSTGGNLCIYGDFTVINLASSDSIAFTIKVQFS